MSGVAIETGQLGPTVGTAAVVAEWALGKIVRVGLVRSGGTYTATVGTLLTGIANPVGVINGPDGALFVSDWKSGTIYRISGS